MDIRSLPIADPRRLFWIPAWLSIVWLSIVAGIGAMPVGGLHAAASETALQAATVTDSDRAAAEADWSIPDEESIGRWIADWAGRAGLEPQARDRVLETWRRGGSNDAPGPPPASAEAASAVAGKPVLDRVLAAIAEADPRVAGMLPRETDPAESQPSEDRRQDLSWLDEPDVDPLVRETVRLHAARQLVERGLFEEALRTLEADGGDPAARVDLSGSVDPARSLFLRAACLHWLLEVERATDALERLLQRADAIPVRYERMARLMLEDLAALEDDSLDHIARRMRDVTRRLSFGRAGSRTREIQDGVIDSLDKLIAKLEQQQQQEQQQQGGGAGGGAGGGSGSRPMQDSMPAGGKGPGEVTKRDLGEIADWGNLPPREREAALQQIGREFPPHYREAIEQYFKRLATGDDRPDAAGSAPRP
jgi:hypothetical protein